MPSLSKCVCDISCDTVVCTCDTGCYSAVVCTCDTGCYICYVGYGCYCDGCSYSYATCGTQDGLCHTCDTIYGCYCNAAWQASTCGCNAMKYAPGVKAWFYY